MYLCGTIPPVFGYSNPNCAPQGAPEGKRSQGTSLHHTKLGAPAFALSALKLDAAPYYGLLMTYSEERKIFICRET